MREAISRRQLPLTLPLLRNGPLPLPAGERNWWGPLRLCLPRRFLRRGEIELDLGAVGVVEEELPGARLVLAAQHIFDVALLELRQSAGEIGRGEGHVIEDAAALLGQGATSDDMQHRAAAAIEPNAGEAQRRSVAFLEAENVAVEFAHRLEILGEDGEMLHALDCHRDPPRGGGCDPLEHNAQRAQSAGMPW